MHLDAPPPTLQSPSVSVTFILNWHSRTRLSQRTRRPDFLSPINWLPDLQGMIDGCTISFGNSSLKISRKHMCFHSGSPDRDLGLDLRHCQCEAQLGSSWLLLPTKTLVALDSFIVRPRHSALGLLPLGKCHLDISCVYPWGWGPSCCSVLSSGIPRRKPVLQVPPHWGWRNLWRLSCCRKCLHLLLLILPTF